MSDDLTPRQKAERLAAYRAQLKAFEPIPGLPQRLDPPRTTFSERPVALPPQPEGSV